MAVATDGTNQVELDRRQVSGGQASRVEMSWSDICTALGNNVSSCENLTAPINDRITIGIDRNNDAKLGGADEDTQEIIVKVHTPANDGNPVDCAVLDTDGICEFTAFPGDEKIFIEDIIPSSGFPSSGNIQISKLMFMYATTSLEDANPSAFQTGQYRTLDVDAESGSGDTVAFTDKGFINPFENEVTYYLRVGTIDQANNLAYITSENAIKNAPGCSGYPTPDDATCQYVATPSEVVGLLSEDVNCFITTAAYQSNMASEVQTFRDFRNHYLLQTQWGRKLVKFYYNVGPKLSRFIIQDDSYRSVARILLWPAWLYAWLSLNIGWGWTTLIFITALMTPFVAWLTLKPRKAQQLEG